MAGKGLRATRKVKDQGVMQTALKVILSIIVILLATTIGRKWPSTAGLIGVMPLTGALVLVWMYLQNRGEPAVMETFARGALWGILPSILFFLAALLCFRRQLPLPIVLLASFGVWLAGAFVHQHFLR